MTTWKTRNTNRISLKSLCSGAIALTFSIASFWAESAVSFKPLHNFKGDPIGTTPTGATPSGQLAQGRDGWLYGTTSNAGVAFKIKPDGTAYRVLHQFLTANPEGRTPLGGLTLGQDGNFYGVTSVGGTKSNGTLFRMTPTGAITVLFAFGSASLKEAIFAPIQAPDGNLYGTTKAGGQSNLGGVYKFNLASKSLTILHHFSGRLLDGSGAQSTMLFARDGNLYGTTYRGGSKDSGTVFRVNPNGTGYKVIYNFSSVKGIFPLGPLAQGNDGNIYGTTYRGGAKGGGSLTGTTFKLTTLGTLTTLHSFDGISISAVGSQPVTGLMLGSDGNFYGATQLGGSGCGTLFKSSPLSLFSVLYQMNKSVDGCFSGGNAWARNSLMLHTNGQFYGLAFEGGALRSGTMFTMSNALTPFIKPDVDAAKVGANIGILGDFTGLTKVTFNGINASFTIVSPTFITAKVPVGAKTGSLIVFKGAAQVKSLKNFVVLP